jgi:hypothetical protein
MQAWVRQRRWPNPWQRSTIAGAMRQSNVAVLIGCAPRTARIRANEAVGPREDRGRWNVGPLRIPGRTIQRQLPGAEGLSQEEASGLREDAPSNHFRAFDSCKTQ